MSFVIDMRPVQTAINSSWPHVFKVRSRLNAVVGRTYLEIKSG